MNESIWKRLNWGNTLFLIISPLLVAIALPLHIIEIGWDWRLLTLFIISCLASSLSITGGYHRLFAHKSYEASKIAKFLYLVFGATGLQGSALKWCTDHRRHHRYVDSEQDPYSISKGFWYAHIGWIFLKEQKQYEGKFAPDLGEDPLVLWQHKYYPVIAIVVGFLAPTLVGLAFGSPWGGLLYGGFARVVVTHHCTFFINSLCHYWGSQTYGDRTSARDNFVMAFFTYGEGYHNFHHRFQADYRNGVRWYQWDPTKWLIWVGSVSGLTWNLKRVQDVEILKARLAWEEKKLLAKGMAHEHVVAMRAKLEAAQERMRELRVAYRKMKSDLATSRDEHIRKLKVEMKLARIEFRAGMAQWQLVLKYA